MKLTKEFILKKIERLQKLSDGKINLPVRYFKRLHVFKGNKGRVRFGPTEMRATSYDWYTFLMQRKGILILNVSAYSSTTGQHVRQVRKIT